MPRSDSLTLDLNDSLILRKIESTESGRRIENNFLIDIRGEGEGKLMGGTFITVSRLRVVRASKQLLLITGTTGVKQGR
jgi:exosome complex RNA-binding protein Rrp4